MTSSSYHPPHVHLMCHGDLQWPTSHLTRREPRSEYAFDGQFCSTMCYDVF
jgi:hypothetical protein